jgi:ribosomal-protein-alanine N-acetyltransferase
MTDNRQPTTINRPTARPSDRPTEDAVPFVIEPMTQEDVPEVSQVERRCFNNPWPTSAYRRELRDPEHNYYVVARWRDPQAPQPGGPSKRRRGRSSASRACG